MSSSALHKAKELSADIRQAVETLVGRPVEPEEHVIVMAYRPHKAPTGAERTELARGLQERIDKTADQLKDVPEAELDPLIDDAVDDVRHHRS